MSRENGRWNSIHGTCLSGMQHTVPSLSSRPMFLGYVASIFGVAWELISGRSLPRRLARPSSAGSDSAVCSLLLHQPRSSESGTRSGNFKMLVNMGPSFIRFLKGIDVVNSMISAPLSQSSFAHLLTDERSMIYG